MTAHSIAYPPSAGDLWRVTYAVNADRGVFAVVWAAEGRYRLKLLVASRDGRGPFDAQGDSDQHGLGTLVATLLERVLPEHPAPETDERSLSLPRDESSVPEAASQKEEPVKTAEPALRFFDEGPTAAPQPQGDVRLAVAADHGFGLARDDFHAWLLGCRVDVRFSERFSVGGYTGYANLPGRDGRVGTGLSYLLVDQRVPVAPGSRVGVPVRLALGYLWRNGTYLRAATGIAVKLEDGLEVVVDVLAPSFLSNPTSTLFSLDSAVELAWTP